MPNWSIITLNKTVDKELSLLPVDMGIHLVSVHSNGLSTYKERRYLMTKMTDLHKQWLKRPGYKKAFDDSQAEFELAHHIIQTRINSGLSQDELAKKMETSQSSIARLESGTSLPSMRTLTKFAKATNTEINISFKPVKAAKAKMRA
jgi:ribosome-binding protein aMBF1 (putative translation factor)